MTERFAIRRAGPDDVTRVTDLRISFLREFDAPDDEDHYREAFERYARTALTDGSYVCWLAEAEDRVVGGGAVAVYVRPATHGTQWREGCVMSMFTEPAYRSRGVGAAVVAEILEYAKRGSVRLWLYATDAGRPIYERAGFREDPRFMRWP